MLVVGLDANGYFELNDFTDEDFDRILPRVRSLIVTAPEEWPMLEADKFSILESLAADPEILTFLVPRRSAPITAFREDPPFSSFACSGSFLRKMSLEITSTKFLKPYHVFCSDTFQRGSARIYAIQVPKLPSSASIPRGGFSWIIPHRGDLVMLACCLSRVRLAIGDDVRNSIMLAVDEATTPELLKLLRNNPGVEAFCGSIAGVGPYVLRNLLIQRSTTEWAVFQDSDDVPSSDRIEKLAPGFDSPDIGMVGSHEIRVDDFNQSVIPVRYPLDVSRALENGPTHSLLHPTSAVRIADFLRAGSFTSTRRHSMDSQFLLRSHFFFRSKNVDEFLYFRRWRAGSLCTAPATALGTLERSTLMTSWGRAFIQALNGTSIADTSLTSISNSTVVELVPIT